MGTRDALEYVKTRTGGSLRVITTYRADDSNRYTRDDVETYYSSPELRERVHEMRETICCVDGLESELGVQYAGLRLFPNVILVHIPPSENQQRGLILSLDREVGRTLTQFIESTAVNWRDGLLHYEPPCDRS